MRCSVSGDNSGWPFCFYILSFSFMQLRVVVICLFYNSGWNLGPRFWLLFSLCVPGGTHRARRGCFWFTVIQQTPEIMDLHFCWSYHVKVLTHLSNKSSAIPRVPRKTVRPCYMCAKPSLKIACKSKLAVFVKIQALLVFREWIFNHFW